MKKRLLLLATTALFGVAAIAQTVLSNGAEVIASSAQVQSAADDAVSYTVSPSSGTVSNIYSITVNFGYDSGNTITMVSGWETASPVVITKDGAQVGTITSGRAPVNYVLYFNLTSPITDAGTYQVTIPGACYQVNGEAGTDIVVDYTIAAPEGNQDYVFKSIDSDGKTSVFEVNSPLVVNYPKATSVKAVEGVDLTEAIELSYAGSKGSVNVPLSDVQISGKDLLIFVDDATNAVEGEYTLLINSGILLLSGVENDEITETFTYEIPQSDYAQILPGTTESVSALSLITIQILKGDEVELSITGRESCPTLTCSSTGSTTYLTTANVTASGNFISIKPSAAHYYIGTDTLRIPGSCYTVDGKAGKTLEYVYTVAASEKTQATSITPVADEEGNVSSISPIVVKFPNVLKVEEVAFSEDYARVEYYSEKSRAGWVELPADCQTQSNSILFFLEEGDQIEGKFRVTIPAGSFTLDGVENEEVVDSFTYVIPLSDYAYVTPYEGEVEALSSFDVTIQKADLVVVSITSREACPTLTSTFGANVMIMPYNIKVDGNKMTYTLNSPYYYVGDYTLTIPGASYTADGVAGKDLEYKFTVVASEKTQEYTITPTANAEGIVTTDISPIVVKFPNVLKVEANPNADFWTQYAYIERQNPKTGGFDQCELTTDDGDVLLNSNYVTFPISANDALEGTFVVNIPAGTFLLDGVENAAIADTLVYEIPQADYAYVTPSEGEVEALSNLTVTIQKADTVVVNITSRESCPTLKSSATGSETMLMPNTNVTAEGNQLIFKLNEPLYYIGDYTLVIPGAGYTADGNPGKDLEFNFTVVKSDKTTEYTVTPEADAEGKVNSISPIVVKFPHVLKVEDNPDADYWTQYAFVEYNSPRAGWGEIPFDLQLQSNSVLFFLEEQDKIDGEFRVTIPAGTYLLDGIENTEVVETFNYVMPQSDYAYVLPAEGSLEQLTTFTVTIPRANEIKTNIVQDLVEPVLYFVSGDYTVAAFADSTINIDGSTITFTLTEPITTLGEYELRIPGNSYTVNGAEGIDLTFKYTVVAPYAVADPENGSEVDSLKTINVTFNYAKSLETAFSYYACPRLYSSATGSTTMFTSAKINGNIMTLTLNSAVYYVGDYTLSIPGGSYKADGVYGQDVTFKFEVVPSEATTAYEIKPAEDTVHTLSPIVVNFPHVLKVEENKSAADYTRVTYINARGMEVEAVITETVQNQSLLISIDEADLKNNTTYYLTIPAGAYYLDSVANVAITDTFFYQLLVPDYTLTVTPSDTSAVEAIDVVTLTVGGVDEVNFDLSSAVFVLIGSNDEVAIATDAVAADSTLTLTFDKITAPATYTLYIPAEVISVNGVAISDILTVTFTVADATGINSVWSDAAAKGAIFNLRGVKVDGNNLKSGIYVIDGKKVLLR